MAHTVAKNPSGLVLSNLSALSPCHCSNHTYSPVIPWPQEALSPLVTFTAAFSSTWNAWLYCSSAPVRAQWLLSCPALCDTVDRSLPGSHAQGVLQARILEWVAMPSSRGSSWPREGSTPHLLCLLHWQGSSLPLAPPRKPPVAPKSLLK